MKVLLTDAAYHQLTKSVDFFYDILRSGFETSRYYFKGTYNVSIPPELVDAADAVVAFQTVLGRRSFVVDGKPCVYVPMYDADWGSRSLWRRIALSGTFVISFCNEISKRARRGGLPGNRLLDVRYAFDPDSYTDCQGDPRVAALWDRGQVGIDVLRKLFPPKFFRKIILFRRLKSGVVFKPLDDRVVSDYNIVVQESEFLPKDEYFKLLKEPGVYIAPRWQEGIGMSFLEQLAMGKCVIAHDDGTMNEYIENGVNGIVRDFRGTCERVRREDIDFVRGRVLERSREQYARWLKDREKIVPFVKAAANGGPVRLGSLRDDFWFLSYLVEAALARFGFNFWR